jgi:hypothetical protein
LRLAIRGNRFSREDNAQSVDAGPAPVNLGELVWAGLVLVAITAALGFSRLDRGHRLEARNAADNQRDQRGEVRNKALSHNGKLPDRPDEPIQTAHS